MAAVGVLVVAGASIGWWVGGPSTRRERLVIDLNTFNEVGEVAYSPDGRTIATPGVRMIPPDSPELSENLIPSYGASQGLVELRDAATGAKGKELRFDPMHEAASVHPILFSPDGAKVVAGNWSGDGFRQSPLLKVWDVASGRLLATLEPPTSEFRDVAFSRDGRHLVALVQTTSDWPTPFRVLRWEATSWTPAEGMTVPLSNIYGTALSPRGDLVAATQVLQNPVVLIEVPSGRVRARITPPLPPGALAPSRNLLVSPDGQTVAVAGSDGDVGLLDVATGTVRATIPQDRTSSGTAPKISFSPDSRLLALGDRHRPDDPAGVGHLRWAASFLKIAIPIPEVRGRVRFADVATGRQRSGFEGTPTALTRITFSPDGKTLVTDGDPPPAVDPGPGPIAASTPIIGSGTLRPRTLNFWDVSRFLSK